MNRAVMLPMLLAVGTGITFIATPFRAHAAVVVTEIMYNPPGANTGRQWVEVANTGTDPIDLGAKTIRLFAGGGDHLIKGVNGSSTTLLPSGVAVIANNPMAFLVDWPNYTGTLLKSTFALTAAGTLGLLDTNGAVLSTVSYTSALGAVDDGNSLQRTTTNEVFVAGAPTPGQYLSIVPAPLVAKVKPLFGRSSSSKQATTHTTTAKKSPKEKSTKSSHSSYEKGSSAPAASADAMAAGALPLFSDSFSIPYSAFLKAILSSVWFAGFLALLGFSGFSLIVIQRTNNSALYG